MMKDKSSFSLSSDYLGQDILMFILFMMKQPYTNLNLNLNQAQPSHEFNEKGKESSKSLGRETECGDGQRKAGV